MHAWTSLKQCLIAKTTNSDCFKDILPSSPKAKLVWCAFKFLIVPYNISQVYFLNVYLH